MKIIWIRHGEPDYALDSLTEKGFREAELLAKRAASWNVDEVLVSTMGRAQDTAVPLLRELDMKGVDCDWLREFGGRINPDYGTGGTPWDFRPLVWTQFDRQYDPWQWYRNPPMEDYGDSSVEREYGRLRDSLDALLLRYGYKRQGRVYQAQEPNDKVIVMVCHMGITMAMLSHLLGIAFAPLIQGFCLPPSSVTIAGTQQMESGAVAFRCQCLGDTRHLHSGGEPISAMGYFSDIFQQ